MRPNLSTRYMEMFEALKMPPFYDESFFTVFLAPFEKVLNIFVTLLTCTKI